VDSSTSKNAVPEIDFGDHLDVLGILGIFKQTDNSMTEIDFVDSFGDRQRSAGD